MTLREIYTWISTNFSGYPMAGPDSQGWQNTVRHNLSLGKIFIKKPEPLRTSTTAALRAIHLRVRPLEAKVDGGRCILLCSRRSDRVKGRITTSLTMWSAWLRSRTQQLRRAPRRLLAYLVRHSIHLRLSRRMVCLRQQEQQPNQVRSSLEPTKELL